MKFDWNFDLNTNEIYKRIDPVAFQETGLLYLINNNLEPYGVRIVIDHDTNTLQPCITNDEIKSYVQSIHLSDEIKEYLEDNYDDMIKAKELKEKYPYGNSEYYDSGSTHPIKGW